MERGAWHAVAVVVALALASGCASAFRPPPGGVPSATIPVGAPGGAWVLAARHTASDCGGYAAAATDRGGLDDLWADFGLPGSAPAVDFGEYAVVAWGYRQGCDRCVNELVAVDLSRDGRLRPVVAPLWRAGSPPRTEVFFRSVAMVVAIPRARLPASSVVAALGVVISDRPARGDVPDLRARDAVLNLAGAPPSGPPPTGTGADEDGEVVRTSRGIVDLPPPARSPPNGSPTGPSCGWSVTRTVASGCSPRTRRCSPTTRPRACASASIGRRESGDSSARARGTSTGPPCSGVRSLRSTASPHDACATIPAASRWEAEALDARVGRSSPARHRHSVTVER